MEKVFIDSLVDKSQVQSAFMVQNKNLNSDKNGKNYLSLMLTDKTGSINAMAWDNVEQINNSISIGDVVLIKAHVQSYQSRLQLIVHTVKKLESEAYHIEDFIKESMHNPEELFLQLKQIISTIQNDNIRQLVESVITAEDFKLKLLKAPAAKTIHHAYVGGLLEHIVSICKIMDFLATHYTHLDRDLLIFGAIFHDIGKVWELEVTDGIQYTNRGRLIGHMQIACEMIDEHSRKIMLFPEELKDILKHIILSHHGRLEYGSPKRPKFLEAMVIAMIDDLDSKINTLQNFMLDEAKSDTSWSRFSPQFERYFYLDIIKNMEKSPK